MTEIFVMSTFLLVAHGYLMTNRIFSSIRARSSLSNARACKSCGRPATKDALFDVGNGIAVVEKYCDPCAKTVEDNGGS